MADVRGKVRGGGDQSPEGRMGGPRRFVYQVETDDGSSVDVAYTAYPPSPFGDRQAQKIRLDFHAGAVQIGDYLVATGRLAEDQTTLEVAEEGDSIQTRPDDS